jgi:hypothetical protein
MDVTAKPNRQQEKTKVDAMKRTLVSFVHTMTLLTLAMGASSAYGQFAIIQDASPQAFSNTCQSYALAYAIGTAPNSPMPIKTPDELRALELDLRKAIEAQAKKQKLTPYHHEVWRAVVPTYTNGVFVLQERFYKTQDEVFKQIEELTGQGAVGSMPVMFDAGLVKTPALVSFDAIENDSYATGHIINVLGIGKRVATGERELLMLNSAVKNKSAGARIVQCAAGITWGDMNYVAVAKVVSRYILKKYQVGYSVMWLARK